jgi:hypothetical protein
LEKSKRQGVYTEWGCRKKKTAMTGTGCERKWCTNCQKGGMELLEVQGKMIGWEKVEGWFSYHG